MTKHEILLKFQLQCAIITSRILNYSQLPFNLGFVFSQFKIPFASALFKVT